MSSSPLRISRRPSLFHILTPLALLCGVVTAATATAAQYGRSTSTGDWGDGAWINSVGVIGGLLFDPGMDGTNSTTLRATSTLIHELSLHLGSALYF